MVSAYSADIRSVLESGDKGLIFHEFKKTIFLDLAIVFAIEIRQGEPLCCVSNLKDILLLCRIFI